MEPVEEFFDSGGRDLPVFGDLAKGLSLEPVLDIKENCEVFLGFKGCEPGGSRSERLRYLHAALQHLFMAQLRLACRVGSFWNGFLGQRGRRRVKDRKAPSPSAEVSPENALEGAGGAFYGRGKRGLRPVGILA